MAAPVTERITNRAIGLEYEVGWQWDAQTTAEKLREMTGEDVRKPPGGDQVYTHQGIDHWKLVFDRSLVFTKRNPFTNEAFKGHELVSPKMAGPDALEKTAKVLLAMEQMGHSVFVNKTCGHHVHFDAEDLQAEDIRKLAASFFIHEEAFDLLMPPSRQANQNERFLRSHRAAMGCDDATAIQRIRGASTIDNVLEVFTPNVGEGMRYYKFNLTNASNGYRAHGRNFRTIEFRQHSATAEAIKSINWIRLLEHFVERTRAARIVEPLPASLTPAEKLTHLFEKLGLPADLREFWWERAVSLDRQPDRTLVNAGQARRPVRVATDEQQQPLEAIMGVLRRKLPPVPSEGGFKLPQNMDEAKALARKSGAFIQEQFVAAKEAGLFSYFKEFFTDIAMPLPLEKLKDKTTMQQLVLVQYPDHEQGFIVGVAGTVWLESLGALFNFLFGASPAYVIFEIVYALLVAYVLYFMVTKSPVAKHAEYALYLFVFYTVLNAWETFTSLIFILPALFIGCKTICSAICSAYTYNIMKKKKGAVPLEDVEIAQ